MWGAPSPAGQVSVLFKRLEPPMSVGAIRGSPDVAAVFLLSSFAPLTFLPLVSLVRLSKGAPSSIRGRQTSHTKSRKRCFGALSLMPCARAVKKGAWLRLL